MNHFGVLTIQSELEQHGTDMYASFPKEGAYKCRLDCRSWYNRNGIYGLVCYFTDLDTESKYKTFCFRYSKDETEMYRPAHSHIDFEKVSDGSVWKISMIKNKKGKIVFDEAEEV